MLLNNIDILLGYTLRSDATKIICRAMLNIGIPVSTKYSGIDLTEYTNPLVGLEVDLGAHFKKFNIGGRFGYSVLTQFESEDNEDTPLGMFFAAPFYVRDYHSSTECDAFTVWDLLPHNDKWYNKIYSGKARTSASISNKHTKVYSHVRAVHKF